MSVCSNAHVTDWYRVAQTVFTPSKIGHYVDDLEICINHRETAKINFELRPDCAHRELEDFAIISRHKGRLLRSVDFARRRGEGHSEGRWVGTEH